MISIIIPAYNEEKTIGLVLDKIKQNLQTTPHEIIVVNDNSTDNTEDIARQKGAILINHTKKTGGNLLNAVEKAAGDIIIRMDADMEHNPDDLPKMIHYFQQHSVDVLLGKRHEFSRKAELLLTKIHHFPVQDLFTGYLAFSGRIKPVVQHYHMNFVFWELPLYAIKHNLNIAEIPVQFERRNGHPRSGGELIGGIRTIYHFYRMKTRIAFSKPMR